MQTKTILITGAANGLGRATSIACAMAGHQVIAIDKDMDGLDSLYNEVEAAGGTTPLLHGFNLAFAASDDYQALSDSLIQQFESIDVLIHAAVEAQELQPSLHIKPNEWLEGIQVNLNAPWLLTLACSNVLMESSEPKLIFVTDDAAAGTPFWGAHGLAKAALETWAQMLSTEYPNLLVECFDPGAMDTATRKMVYSIEESGTAPSPKAAAQALIERILA